MLALAGVGPRDFVVDLGSGDGRLVIAAASRHGARARRRHRRESRRPRATQSPRGKGSTDRVTFREQDLFDTDLPRATVVTIYLLPSIMDRVAVKLRAELRPGTRVVAHDFPARLARGPRALVRRAEKRDYTFNERATVYLYRAPGPAAR